MELPLDCYKLFPPLLSLSDTYNALVNSLSFSVISEEKQSSQTKFTITPVTNPVYLDELLFLNK